MNHPMNTNTNPAAASASSSRDNPCYGSDPSAATLNVVTDIKEFAVLAGVSYSVAREWFHLPGFPALLGKVFWADFVLWRRSQNRPKSLPSCNASKNAEAEYKLTPHNTSRQWPARAANILAEVH